MKLLKIISLSLIMITLQSCFEVVEEISLNNNGSGTFKYTVNFSQSTTRIKSLMLLDEVEGFKVPTEYKINAEFDKIVTLSNGINGISNVEKSTDFENYIFIYTCNFNKIENLNAIIDSLSKKSKSINQSNTNYFSYSVPQKLFERKGDDVLKQAYNKLSDSQKRIFTGAQYTSLYRFKDEVVSVSEPNAKVSVNKKAVLHKLYLLSLVQRGEAINKKIHLK